MKALDPSSKSWMGEEAGKSWRTRSASGAGVSPPPSDHRQRAPPLIVFVASWNREKGRISYDSVIMERRMKVHRSVRIRMSAEGTENKRYLPKSVLRSWGDHDS